MKKENIPIFIVGVPRSGTTLLASMLAAHKRLDCGPETHFFCNLTRKQEKLLSNKKYWPNSAIEYLTSLKNYIWSLKNANKNIFEVFKIPINEIEKFLISNNPGVKTTLESLTFLHTIKNKKERWIEKTPNHLVHIPKIKKYYPHSPIIRIFRDFRDSAISLTKVPWGNRSLLSNIYFINNLFYKSESFLKDFSEIFLISYEKLVYNPEDNLFKLCSILNEEFDINMLTWNKMANKLYGNNEWWKKSVSSSLDKSRCFVWKNSLDEETKFLLSFAAYSALKAYNYEVDNYKIKKQILFYPANSLFVKNNENTIYNLAKKGIRVLCCYDLESFKGAVSLENINVVFLILPILINKQYPLHSTNDRIIFILKFLKLLNTLKAKNIPIYNITRQNVVVYGKAELLIKKFLTYFANKSYNQEARYLINEFKF